MGRYNVETGSSAYQVYANHQPHQSYINHILFSPHSHLPHTLGAIYSSQLTHQLPCFQDVSGNLSTRKKSHLPTGECAKQTAPWVGIEPKSLALRGNGFISCTTVLHKVFKIYFKPKNTEGITNVTMQSPEYCKNMER